LIYLRNTIFRLCSHKDYCATQTQLSFFPIVFTPSSITSEM
jgi:hypothetical protein